MRVFINIAKERAGRSGQSVSTTETEVNVMEEWRRLSSLCNGASMREGNEQIIYLRQW